MGAVPMPDRANVRQARCPRTACPHLLRLASTALILCGTFSPVAGQWIDVEAPWDGQTIPISGTSSPSTVMTKARLTQLPKGDYRYEVLCSGEGTNSRLAEVIGTKEEGVELDMYGGITGLLPGKFRQDFGTLLPERIY